MTQQRTVVFSTPIEPSAALRAGDHRKTDLNGCPWHDVKSMLRDVGLRPTRQRMSLGWILFVVSLLFDMGAIFMFADYMGKKGADRAIQQEREQFLPPGVGEEVGLHLQPRW